MHYSIITRVPHSLNHQSLIQNRKRADHSQTGIGSAHIEG